MMDYMFKVIRVGLPLTKRRFRSFLGASCKHYSSVQSTEEESHTEWHDAPFKRRQVPAVPPESEVGETKKPKRKSFAKELFMGRVDTDALAFPEVLNREEKAKVDKKVTMYTSLLNQSEPAESPEFLLKRLKDLSTYNEKLETATNTEYISIMESLSHNQSLAAALANHGSGCVHGLLKQATSAAKSYYLPKLSCGDFIAGLLFFEPQGAPQISKMHCKAEYNSEEDLFYISGTKTVMATELSPNLFIVLALTEVIEQRTGLDEIKPTAFLVEKDHPGVKVSVECDNDLFYGHKILRVTFNNTPVPSSNILGDMGDGVEIANSILRDNRLAVSAMSLKLLQRLIDWVVNHAIEHYLSKVPLKNLETLLERLGKCAHGTYAVESMLYFTTGITDLEEDPNIETESAMLRVFSSEMAWNHTDNILRLLSYAVPPATRQMYDEYFREARSLLFHEESNDVLKIFIAMSGLQHAGREWSELIMKMRSPLFHPGFQIKHKLARLNQVFDKPKLKLKLHNYLHPSLKREADMAEYLVLRLSFVTETLLYDWGSEIGDKHTELQRLSDIAISIFSLLACISRANRSYCIGLPHSQIEMQIVNNYTLDVYWKLKSIIHDILIREEEKSDRGTLRVAKKLLNYKGYCLSTPLQHNP